jgi:hypothetical protein
MRRGHGGANDGGLRVASDGTSIAFQVAMLDSLFVVASIAFFALACAYAVACDRL